jgi:gas vesicle protein
MNDQNDPRKTGFNFGQVMLALLGGAAAGAAAVYLTAPRSGEETRRRLQGAADGTRDTVQRVPEALRKATEAAREAFNEALANGSHHA